MSSILCLKQMHFSFLLVANSTFAITKPNLCVISNDSNSLASVKEIEKIPSPVWALGQQKHWGKGLSLKLSLHSVNWAHVALPEVSPPGELSVSSATGIAGWSCHQALPALCCMAGHAGAIKLLKKNNPGSMDTWKVSAGDQWGHRPS